MSLCGYMHVNASVPRVQQTEAMSSLGMKLQWAVNLTTEFLGNTLVSSARTLCILIHGSLSLALPLHLSKRIPFLNLFPPPSLPFCCSLSSPSSSFLCFPMSLSTSFPFALFLYHTPFLPLFPPSFECQIFQQLIGNYWIFWMPILKNLFAWSKWKKQKIHVSQYSSTQYIFTILHVFLDGRN